MDPSVNFERAKSICCEVFGDKWLLGPIHVQPLKGGFFNELLLCSIGDKETTPHQALVRLISGSNAFCSMGEAGEALAFSAFAAKGLGPNLYAAFPGGRVEEFIPSRNLSIKDYNDKELTFALARKLALIHSLDIPIRKEASVLLEKYTEIGRKVFGKINAKMDSFTESERLKAKTVSGPQSRG